MIDRGKSCGKGSIDALTRVQARHLWEKNTLLYLQASTELRLRYLQKGRGPVLIQQRLLIAQTALIWQPDGALAMCSLC